MAPPTEAEPALASSPSTAAGSSESGTRSGAPGSSLRTALRPHGYDVQHKMLTPRSAGDVTQRSALAGDGSQREAASPAGQPNAGASSLRVQRKVHRTSGGAGEVVQREGDGTPPVPPENTPLPTPEVPDPAALAADLPTESFTEVGGELVTLKIEVSGGGASVKAGAVDVAGRSDSVNPMQLAGVIGEDVKNYINPATPAAERTRLLAKIKSDMKALKTAMAKARGEDKPIISLRGTFEKDIGAKAFSGAEGFGGGHTPVNDMVTAALSMIAASSGRAIQAGQNIDTQLAALGDIDEFKAAIEDIGIPTTIGFAGAVGKSFEAITNALTNGSLTQKCVHLINFGDRFIKPGLLDTSSGLLEQIKANLSGPRFIEFKAKVDTWRSAGGDKKKEKVAGKALFSEQRFTDIVDSNGAMDTKTPEIPLEALDRQALFRLAAQKNVELTRDDTQAVMIEKLKAAGVKPETTSSNADMEMMPDKAGLTVEGMPYIQGIKANIVNPDHKWIIAATDADMPLKAGISGTTHRFLGLGELLGVADKAGMRLAMLGHLQAIEAHSFWEICDAVGMGPPAGKYVPFDPVPDASMEAAARETLQQSGTFAEDATGQNDLTLQVKRLLGTHNG